MEKVAVAALDIILKRERTGTKEIMIDVRVFKTYQVRVAVNMDTEHTILQIQQVDLRLPITLLFVSTHLHHSMGIVRTLLYIALPLPRLAKKRAVRLSSIPDKLWPALHCHLVDPPSAMSVLTDGMSADTDTKDGSDAGVGF